MKFDLKIDEYVKRDQLRMSLKIWDKDLIKSNEFLSEATIDLSKLVFESIESEAPNRVVSPHQMFGSEGEFKGKEKFLVPTLANPTRGSAAKAGSILISIDVMPVEE